ncbi:1,4-dihydroxy-2-naphthoate octaprenyltransferase [Pontimicrobium aquaticum]|uniref:1,4-dihydroxy-2-naphthoate octaprenyltransferase n=1 Tax=Pontimicrobium aquaticum TaxID=2565367 RepID=A0A4U0ERR8_9FLAO|nr:1,4-dihydroxy-2-naphthoate octaprenyltransferase [Pontimicrobium aquaticum]TJY33894.1 1,4-dihydroxy-2-naphthoate octaprenyltransferase [Pontimicrobium aquaticum]
MEKIKPWISAFRLRTLPLSVSGIIVGSCLAYYNGAFNMLIFILALLATISLQILSNLANDYGDGVKGTDNEERIGPERALQSGKITPEEMFSAIRINILIVILFVFLLIYNSFGSQYFLYAMLFFALGVISIFAALKYTIGKSAYGYRALGDVMVFMFFGLLSVLGTYFLYTKQLDHVLLLPAFSIGLLSTGVLNLNNMRDIESDTNANKITVAVKLGFKKAKAYHVFLIVSAIVFSLLFGVLYYRTLSNFMFVIAFIPLVTHLLAVIKAKEAKSLDPQLKVLALSTFLLAILLGIGQIIHIL